MGLSQTMDMNMYSNHSKTGMPSVFKTLFLQITNFVCYAVLDKIGLKSHHGTYYK